ncbi:hypothetical protein Naga_100078g7 [Nannochloropsis gaditana]|uniref:Transmembrane protein n=1 Tax=Nannochloropsis gaditana TaxID=72520 RepID=W7U0Z4_9STRA|nr:hypothetical protein Naga_100078g7 [Nannochloropsis gaditana]
MRPFLEIVVRLVPACMVVGASMELFMLNTGFYDVALRKEAERRVEQAREREELSRKMERTKRRQLE